MRAKNQSMTRYLLDTNIISNATKPIPLRTTKSTFPAGTSSIRSARRDLKPNLVTEWDENGATGNAKFEIWWPGTELNRRRQPFQFLTPWKTSGGRLKCFKSRERHANRGLKSSVQNQPIGATIELGFGSPFVVGFSYQWQLTIPRSNT
jgi:hypothetical protein